MAASAAIGAGANELTVCDRFLALGEVDFILLALRYTLLDQTADDGFLEKAIPQCERRGRRTVSVGILATGSFRRALQLWQRASGDHRKGHEARGCLPGA